MGRGVGVGRRSRRHLVADGGWRKLGRRIEPRSREHWRLTLSGLGSAAYVSWNTFPAESFMQEQGGMESLENHVGKTDKRVEARSIYLAKILAPEGSKDVPVGKPIAITVEDGDEIKDISADSLSGVEVKEQSSGKHVKPKQREVNRHQTNISRISPSAKLLITEHGINASSLKASGPRGTLLKGDVLSFINGRDGSQQITSSEKKVLTSEKKTSTTASSPPSGIPTPIKDAYKDLPNSLIRKRSGSATSNQPHPDLVLRQHSIHTPTTFATLTLLPRISVHPHCDSRLLFHTGLLPSRVKPLPAHAALAISNIPCHSIADPSVASASSTSLALAAFAHAIPTGGLLPCTLLLDPLWRSPTSVVIAKRLLESKQSTPHFYLSSDVILDHLLSFRKELKEQHNIKVSVNDIVIKAVALALRSVPEVNADLVNRELKSLQIEEHLKLRSEEQLKLWVQVIVVA
ncbi:hypothetical protein KSP40_PGU000008 [Platanthera guangdongensis]|uniref:Peripheral subunit-binding (PSBD) domain-containing protein n=1 Tax=Platanthera guangdongensis TaxID=2320717 RepID=A0ABR2LTN9_9ASPA